MPKYLISHTVDHPRFTAGKVYESTKKGAVGAIRYITDDTGLSSSVITENKLGIYCHTLNNQDTWKWCDKEGNLK